MNLLKKYGAAASIFAVFALMGATVFASQVAVSQGYKTSEEIPAGALVALDKGSADTVKLASSDNVDDLVGAAVAPQEPLLSVSSNSNEVQVATSGLVAVLVSDINGTVKQGDRITASSIRGVGMRSTDSGRLLGVAQSNLADAKDKQTVQATSKDGKTKSVEVGRINVLINVSFYTASSGGTASYLPLAVQQLSNTVAGKQVAPLRIVLSFILLLVAVIISIVLVYSAVRSSIISIGRNPLSQPAVRRSLFQVLSFVVAVLLVTLISVYLILSR